MRLHDVHARASARAESISAASAVLVPATLVGLAGLHVAWALGWRWPGGSDREFVARVVGNRATEVPPVAATWAVAVALLGAAGIVRAAAATETASRGLRVATWGIAGAFLARGAISIPVDLVRGFDEPYERLDLTIYSPLCLALGGATAVLARGTSAA